jgi:EAL domain-containing protein (putative c-di-GMP-specific phosphodiesterase class I)
MKTIIALAHSLELKCIAEGVETEERLISFRGCECDNFRGYLLSQPVLGEQIPDFLTTNPRVVTCHRTREVGSVASVSLTYKF